MRICQIGSLHHEIIRRWIKWLLERGHEVHIVVDTVPSLQDSTLKMVKGAHIHVLSLNSSRINFLPFSTLYQSILSSRKIIKKINPDIVHGHFVPIYGLPTIFSGNYPKVISIWGMFDLMSWNSAGITLWKDRLIRHITLKKIDAVHSFAENLSDIIVSLGINKEMVHTIPVGADTQNFNVQAEGSEIKSLFELEENPTVISIRQMAPVYNVECLINAIPIIIKRVPLTKFVIKTGSMENKYWINKLKNKVKEMNLQDYVKFIDYVPYEDLPKYLACADVYVSTSLFDGLGISNIEALACGTPAVLADIDSTRNLIKKGLHAHLYPPKDSKALAKEIISSIKNREKNDKEIHKENFEIIKKHYDFDNNMEKIEQLYKNLIERHKK
ncbi:hypothetical protein CVT91_06960 [Candidatus Atribacteria bacterium HGW-Atribacteria-1]|nr:MAG: hypothetical protein CVT91_06960 [Candidatus Atribacteria bacterium HGW-Atribacteria-1]